MSGTIADVRCTTCGAPARYDIVRQQYHCDYCGSEIQTSEALRQKQGFRAMQQENIRQSEKKFKLMRATCSGCGAELVFDTNEALTTCAFCGRALVRKDYIKSKEVPEMIIPFRITKEEAAGCLREWCGQNKGRREAKHLQAKSDLLEGFYLPYELIRGPVSCEVSRMDSGRKYHCGGYVDNVFVNCSKQLNNLLLDGMEPFELEDLQPFDFAFAAGQRIKIKDVDSKELTKRVDREVSNDYTPVVRQTLETQAVEVSTDPTEALRMPVLLPVYYIQAEGTLAAVNGQTGKVSVRADKQSHYYFLPWWLKSLIATIVITGGGFLAFRLFGMAMEEAMLIAGVLGLFALIVTLCAYSDTIKNKFRVESGRKIFTSTGGPLRRSGQTLVRDPKELEKTVTEPVFFEKLNGKTEPVKLVFSSLRRRLKTGLLAAVVLFLPVLVALLLNGFDFKGLHLGGSAVWFCIMVPVVPIYILKFAIIQLYERPWIYTLTENGRWKRYKKPQDPEERKRTVKAVLRAIFVPPVSLGVWFGIFIFFVICYLTAYGF